MLNLGEGACMFSGQRDSPRGINTPEFAEGAGMHTENLESALSSSALGDPIGKCRMRLPRRGTACDATSSRSEIGQMQRDGPRPVCSKDMVWVRSSKAMPLPKTGRVRFSVGKKRPSDLRYFRLTDHETDGNAELEKLAGENLDATKLAGSYIESEETASQSSSTDTDDDGKLIQQAMKAKDDLLRRKNVPKAITSKKKSRVAGPKSGAANLKLLIDEAILSPGIGVLSLEYRGTREIANLCADGRIQWKDNLFNSPSAFSIFIKRLINPTRKADDGWKTVRFAGNALDHYKHVLATKKLNQIAKNEYALDETKNGKLSHQRIAVRRGD